MWNNDDHFDPWAARDLSDDELGPLITDPGGASYEKTSGPASGPIDFASMGAQQTLTGVPPPMQQYPSPGEPLPLPGGGAEMPYSPQQAMPPAQLRIRPLPEPLRRRGVRIMVCVMVDGGREVFR